LSSGSPPRKRRDPTTPRPVQKNDRNRRKVSVPSRVVSGASALGGLAMNRLARAWLLLLVLLGAAPAPAAGPLSVHPTNRRYFTDGSGKAIYLTGSHVWQNFQDRGTASPPPAFDYTAYLDFLQARNHNFIRLWNWEQARWAPWTTGEEYVTPLPFTRTGPGTALDGGAKFNLDQFNQAYFDRLRARVIAARDRGIYVSIMLFEGWSIDNVGKGSGNPWPGHPFNASNNVNGVNGDLNGNGQGEEIHTLASATVTSKQDGYVRKVVDTVNDLDNVLYEIANESGSTMPGSTNWQYHMIDLIHSYEAGKPKKHPVGMTFQYPNGNNSALFSSPADWISPNGAGGYDSNPPPSDGSKVILSDTDHIWGEGGDRSWVWKSFTRGIHTLFMDGGIETFPATNDWRESARRAMGQTRSYADRMNLAAMTPRGDLTSTGYALAAVGAEYLVYQAGAGAFTVNLAAGSYSAEWLNPATGAASAGGTFPGGSAVSFTPPFGGDAVLYLKAGSAPPPPAGELVGQWALDEGSGTTAGDSSGKGNTGTLLNGAAWTSGKTGTAVPLDGVDDSIRVPSSTSLNSTTNQLTVAAWIYRNASQPSWRLVVSRQRGTSYDDQYILGFLDKAYQFGVNTSGTSGLASGGTAPNGQWIH